MGIDEVPAPLEPFGQASLKDFVKKGLPATPRESLTKTMQKNLEGYEKLIEQKLKDGTLSPGSLVVCELDRGFGKTYKPSMTENMSPCLKTGLRYLFMISTNDVGKPDHEREFFRWLMPYERPGLQGCDPSVSTTLRADHLIHACGNAYPVNLIAACLVPVLNLIEDSKCLKSSRFAPKTKTLPPGDLDLPDCHGFFMKMLGLKKPETAKSKRAPKTRLPMKKGPKSMKKCPKTKGLMKKPGSKQVLKKPGSKKGGKGRKSQSQPQKSITTFGVVLTLCPKKKRSCTKSSDSD